MLSYPKHFPIGYPQAENSRNHSQRVEVHNSDGDRLHTNRVGASNNESAFPAQADNRNDPFELTPRLEMHRSLAAEAIRLGIESPYFLVHEGRASASTVINGIKVVNFSSYDYLGFNQHPDVERAAIEAIRRHGVSPSASRPVAGERQIHGLLEKSLARHYHQENGLTFVSGYGTNVSVIAALMGSGDLVLINSLAHNSIFTGAKLSGAKVRSFPHNDLNAVDAALRWRRSRYRRVLIVAEGLYSMEGDVCDLPRLVEIKERHRAALMIDDAHGLGVLGENGYGCFEHFGVDPRHVDIWMGTLSKALASSGGYIAASSLVVEYLRHNAGGFVFSVALAPALASSALAALDLLVRSPGKVRQLRENARQFVRIARSMDLDLGNCVGVAIIPVMVRDSLQALAVSSRLQRREINAQPIIHPAVAVDAARLRFFMNADHTAEDIAYTVSCVAEEVRRLEGRAAEQV